MMFLCVCCVNSQVFGTLAITTLLADNMSMFVLCSAPFKWPKKSMKTVLNNVVIVSVSRLGVLTGAAG